MKTTKKMTIEMLATAILSAFALSAALAENAPAMSSVASTARPDAQTPDVYGDGLEKWTSWHSVHTRYFLIKDQRGVWDWNAEGSAVAPSPDGGQFFFVSWHGELDGDGNIFELTVHSTAEVVRAMSSGSSRAPDPVRVFVVSDAKEGGIANPHWTEDGDIEFIGYAPNTPAAAKVWRLRMESGHVQNMTGLSNVRLGAYSEKRDGRIFVVGEAETVLPASYPLFPVTERRMGEFFEGGSSEVKLKTFAAYADRPSWQLGTGFEYGKTGPWFSPDGRFAVMVRRPKDARPEWSRYIKRKNALEKAKVFLPPSHQITQFMWIDLERETESAMLDAPVGWTMPAGATVAPQALWSADGQQIVLVNTVLPAGSEADPDMAYIVAYDVTSRRWEILEPLVDEPARKVVQAVTWIKTGQQFLVEHKQDGKAINGTVYTLRGSKWVPRPAGAGDRPPAVERAVLAQGLKVELRQGPNTPPSIVASLKGRELTLTSPDPALKNVWRAKGEVFQWSDSAGKTHAGTLLLPRALPPDRQRIPLVVQTKNVDLSVFRPQGPSVFMGFGAQSLVAQGMAVLNLDEESLNAEADATKRPAAEVFLDWIDAAATAVAKAYPIDLNRVGLVGFSSTGYLVRYAVTFPGRLHPAAAVIMDSAQSSFQEYLIAQGMDDPVGIGGAERRNGGPFYESKSVWLEREVNFNVDRVHTPTLFLGNGGESELVWAQDKYGAFKANRKAFDYIITAGKAHDPTAPRLREATQDAVLDWMNFWLQGKETSRADDPNRFERWQAQRKLFGADQARAELKSVGVPDPRGNQDLLNREGYRALYDEKNVQKAMLYLGWNLKIFSGTKYEAALHDSLAEAFLQAGNVSQAIEHYRQALSLGYQNPQATVIIEQLENDPKTLPGLQEQARQAYIEAVKEAEAARGTGSP